MGVFRFWEIDALRGVAVVAMIVLHVFFNLRFFSDIVFLDPYILWFAAWLATRTAFILLCGLSLTISFSKMHRKEKPIIRKKYVKRGLRVFGLGLIITVFTFLAFPEQIIFFGILHFIGISIILAMPLYGLKWKNLFLALLFFATGFFLEGTRVNTLWLSWVGFIPGTFPTFDLVPLIPWFGFILIGLFLGNVLYPKGKRLFAVKERGSQKGIAQLTWLGRNSLIIYFAHQPILIATIVFLTNTMSN